METSDTAILLAGFGAPERPGDVDEFLRRVASGRDIPAARLREAAEHYREVGSSPYNASVRAQAEALGGELSRRGLELPFYVGMRNWNPSLLTTIRKMATDGVRRAALIIMAPHSGPESTERYQTAIAEALRLVGPGAPALVPVAPWHAERGFVQAIVERISELLAHRESYGPAEAAWIFTAHSIPLRAANRSPYVTEYNETVGRVAAELGIQEPILAFQSRSGHRNTRWLEPDVRDALKEAAARGKRAAVVTPVGFVNENVELLYDLDTEAARVARAAGLRMLRTKTVGDHPRFVSMLADLVDKALSLGISV